jgi:F-type H+-transporting ATPase subunit delta
MAELSTIARPYAEALFEAAQSEGAPLAGWLGWLEELAPIAGNPQVETVAGDPNLDAAQLFDLLAGLLKTPLPAAGANFLRTLIDNGRLAALPEIARQFRGLKNAAEGMADCTIESAFPLDDGQVADLVGALTRKFGLQLKAQVVVDPALIGGVRVAVGDHVLDTTVKTRLAQMQAALTAP